MFVCTVQGSPVEIHTPAHWNLIDRGQTTPNGCFGVLQNSSNIFVQLLFHCRKEKSGGLLNILCFFFAFFLLYLPILLFKKFLSLKLRSLKLLYSRSVCIIQYVCSG